MTLDAMLKRERVPIEDMPDEEKQKLLNFDDLELNIDYE